MPNLKPVAFAAAATAALACAPITPAAAAGPLLVAPWAIGHVIAGLARLAAAASVASAAASAYPGASYSPASQAPAYGYGAPPPAYYPPPSAYPGYVAQPRYYPQPAYSPGYAYAPPRYVAAPPAYYSPAVRSYQTRSYYGSIARYARPSPGGYASPRAYSGAAMRYSGAYGRGFSYRSRGFYRR